MQSVLVAGASGILGREVTRLLHEEGHRVKTFSRNPARAKALQGIADENAAGDATNLESLGGAFDGVDTVVSCLGSPVTFTVGGDRRSFRAVGTMANRNLIQAARQAPRLSVCW
jgi:2-alkyl-3-oxoalkanoate reductase